MRLNAGISGMNRLAGTNIPRISNPAGGPGTFQQGLEASGALTDAQPRPGDMGAALPARLAQWLFLAVWRSVGYTSPYKHAHAFQRPRWAQEQAHKLQVTSHKAAPPQRAL
ncbi:MAG: hypothetical protein AAF252_16420 [Pseudomonadota bacterium]